MAVVHLEVRGVVQGVGFRWFTVRVARRAGLRGWVRNCSDGSVEITAAGDPASLDRFVNEVRQGPPGARVDHIRELPVDHGDNLGDEFEAVR